MSDGGAEAIHLFTDRASSQGQDHLEGRRHDICAISKSHKCGVGP